MANKGNVGALTGAGSTANLTGANAPIFNNSGVFSNPITQTNQNSGIGFTYKSTNNSYQGNYTTYNKNYPGFDKDDYEILERMAAKSGKTGQAKKDLMDELYMQYYEQVVNKHQLDDRSQVIKEQAFSTKDYQGNDKKVQQTKVKLADLSQKAKKKFGIDATVSDEDIINSMTNSIPNGGELLENYINNGDKEYLYATGLEDDTILNRAGDVATDVVGGAYDSATSLPRMAGKGIANAIGWAAKQLGADEDKVNSLVQSYKDYLDNEMSGKAIGANTDSFAYQATKTVGDLTQVAAGEGALRGAIQGTAKGGQLLNYLKNAPTWQKMVAGGVEGAGDMALYSIVAENKLPTAGETGVGAAIGSVIPGAGALYKAGKPLIQKTLGKTASQLQLSGLLNPAKLNTIKNNLINEGTDLATAGLKGGTAEDVGTWMIERGFNGDKEKIITDLGEYAKKSHNLKREVLGVSESLHDVESAKKSLQIIRDTIEDVPGLENRLKRVDELLGKEQHTLAELDEIKSILDDTKNLYTVVGNPKAGAVNDGLIKVRQDLRKYIEDAAEKEGLGNIKMLNNETQIAKGLQDGISRKDSADAAREMLSVFSKSAIGGAAGYNVGPFDSDTMEGKIGNVILGALAGKYLFSTASKTKLASLINKMSGGSKKELSRLVAGDLEAIKLSNKTKKELENLFKEVEASQNIPTEMTPEEWEALYKKYSYSDLPALEFKEGIVDDAGKTIITSDSEKIIGTPSGTNLREGKIGELPTENINYVDNAVEDTTEAAGKTMKESIPENKLSLSDAEMNEIKNGTLNDNAANQLVALHNLSKENLEKAAKLGGFPMPSIAVTKKGVPHDAYGDISIVFKKETVDPAASKSNKLYGVDAWTPTFPNIKAIPKDTVEADKILSKIEKETGLSYGELSQWMEYRDVYERDYPILKEYADDFDKLVDYKIFDGFTPSGKRKYLDYNLDNVVKYMKKQDETSPFGNFGKLVGEEKGKLKDLEGARGMTFEATDKDAFNNLSKEYSDAMYDVYSNLEGKNSYLDFGSFSNIIESTFNKNTKKWLEKAKYELMESGKNLTVEDLEKIHKPIKDGANLKRPFAESKPERAVTFDEVNYVLAPEEQAAEVEKLLGDKVQVVPYKSSEGRSSKLQELQKKYGNVFFGVGGSIFPISYLLGNNSGNLESEGIES